MDRPKKRRFRFGLRTLLFVVVLFAAALSCVSWWITWPQRTAVRFVNLMASAPDRAEEMSPGSGMWNVLRKYEHEPPYFEPHSRSLIDTLRGIQTFTVAVHVIGPKLEGKDMEFTGTLLFERGQLNGPIELDSRFRRPELRWPVTQP